MIWTTTLAGLVAATMLTIELVAAAVNRAFAA
jgi:hypothetical protein